MTVSPSVGVTPTKTSRGSPDAKATVTVGSPFGNTAVVPPLPTAVHRATPSPFPVFVTANA